MASNVGGVPAFLLEVFFDAFIMFIAANDQSFNIIESPELHQIFLMLREELTDADIRHSTDLDDPQISEQISEKISTDIQSQVMEIWEEHLKQLSREMQSALGKFSFMTDLWSIANLVLFMAIMAYWIDTKEVHPPNGRDMYLALMLRADLIGFHCVPGHHDGEHLARAFLHIVDHLCIALKMGWISLDNASNNNTMLAWLETLLTQQGIPFDTLKWHIQYFMLSCLQHV
ncbi:uncharacterized protein ARMOST_10323 [Armillaria ostoyae]|uniref:Uncharacterized protein n=1 Tax=Armillaria ostoyae TaxID=47428 RepID=A0A284RE00_ARMOS|nr:uncharacterized protein ARMOST_10323 [Armillaria ostoyae]